MEELKNKMDDFDMWNKKLNECLDFSSNSACSFTEFEYEFLDGVISQMEQNKFLTQSQKEKIDKIMEQIK